MTREAADTRGRPPDGGPVGTVSPAVAYGLLAAWAVHDLEEVLAFEPWVQRALPRLRGRFSGVPDGALRVVESTDAPEFAVAVGIVGGVMATASLAGQLSGGRSRFFQLMLAGFGLHAAGHVASAVGVRGYAPGVATAQLVAAPFSVWAIGRLKAAGVWRPLSAGDIIPAAALTLAVLGGSHAIARVWRGWIRR
jgi:Protein of unknown function with HXXEE motif